MEGANKYADLQFSAKSIIKQLLFLPDNLHSRIRCPPFTDKKLDWMMWLTKKSPKKGGISGFLPIVVLGMIFAFLFKVTLFADLL